MCPVGGVLEIDVLFFLCKTCGGESIRLKVRKTMARELLENLKTGIFRASFFTTKKDVGTGLGLWVCKEIAERHGGTVQVESENGHGGNGAIFTVLLPDLSNAPAG